MHIGKTSSSDPKKYPPGSFMGRLRERKIIATLAAFAGSGVVIIEVAHHILVNHYHLPHQIVDICIVTLVGALLGTLTWRWFRGAEKRPGNVKVEVLVVPLIILLALVIDLKFIFKMTGIPINMLLIGIAALCLGVAWIIFKSLQWAASVPEAGQKVEILIPTEEKSTAEPVIMPEWNNSIIVLPFNNLSPEEGQDYFCDGMTEEIITDLSKVPTLKVISRSSAMTFKGTEKKVREIANDVNVQYVLEGSVRKAGNDLRITAQLIEAASDAHLWAEKYSGTLDDVFDIQEKVSNAIVEQLKIKLTLQDVSRVKDTPVENVKAYDCYLHASYELRKMSQASFDRARDYLQKSLDIIGENALLYALMGQAYYWYHDAGYDIDVDPLKEAEKYAKKAYTLNPNLAPIHFLFGLLERGRGNLNTAVKYMKQAVDIDPADPNILSLFIWCSSAYTGKAKEMSPFSRDLLEIDPVTPLNYLTTSMVYQAEGQWIKAAESLRKSVEMDPGLRWGHFWLAQILARAQNREEFYEVGDILLEGDSEDIIAQWIKFLRNVHENDRENAFKTLTEELKNFAWQDPEGVWLMAGSFAVINEKDKALKWLEHAIERGWINYPLFAKIDPFLENIRSEPRFKKLMARVKHDWENFEL